MKKDGYKFLREWRDYANTLSDGDYRKGYPRKWNTTFTQRFYR